jgi:hypothetical protein
MDSYSQAQKLLAEAKKLSDDLFEKSQAFNNIIILAGFGGLFALLGPTKDLMPRCALAIVATFIGIALIAYVGFVLYNIVQMGKSAFDTGEKLLKNIQIFQRTAAENTSETEKALRHLAFNKRLWAINLIICASSALAAGGIMLFWYIKNILS